MSAAEQPPRSDASEPIALGIAAAATVLFMVGAFGSGFAVTVTLFVLGALFIAGATFHAYITADDFEDEAAAVAWLDLIRTTR